MATEPRERNGKYEISVCVNGVRKSATRRTKQECRLWAKHTEKLLREGKKGEIHDKTFGELLRHYGKTVSIKKRTADKEKQRIEAFCRWSISNIQLKDLRPSDFAEWRDMRLEQVSAASVIRDWAVMSHAIKIAINEWGWMHENPMAKVKRPATPISRDRLITVPELERLLISLGYNYDIELIGVSQRVGAALLFAVETAMRQSEIANLEWRYVDIEKRVAHLPQTKNGFPRDVPLTHEAVRILQQVKSDSENVFNLTAQQIESNFRKAKKRADVSGVTFHDSRATAITRLAARVDILTLARITGHKDLKMLQIYYRESMEDIAKRI